MNLRLIGKLWSTPIPQDQVTAARALLVPGTTNDWTPAILTGYITTQTLPEQVIQEMVQAIVISPTFVMIEKDALLRALAEVRPDLVAVLQTPAGDSWLDRCFATVNARVAMSLLFGGAP